MKTNGYYRNPIGLDCWDCGSKVYPPQEWGSYHKNVFNVAQSAVDDRDRADGSEAFPCELIKEIRKETNPNPHYSFLFSVLLCWEGGGEESRARKRVLLMVISAAEWVCRPCHLFDPPSVLGCFLLFPTYRYLCCSFHIYLIDSLSKCQRLTDDKYQQWEQFVILILFQHGPLNITAKDVASSSWLLVL